MKGVFIDGLGIGGYRSFGEEMQYVGPCRQINLLIGQNNSGKSNVLSFLARLYGQAVKAVSSTGGGHLSYDEVLDPHIDPAGRRLPVRVSIGVELGSARHKLLIENSIRNVQKGWEDFGRGHLDKILRSQYFTAASPLAWLNYSVEKSGDTLQPPTDEEQKLQAEFPRMSIGDWRELWTRLTQRGGQGDVPQYISEILALVRKGLPKVPAIAMIRAVRQVESHEGEDSDHSGRGLIKALARMQHPGFAAQHLKRDFDEINQFLRKVLGNSTARLEIPVEQNVIEVEIDGRMLPLSSLGTGVTEVIILAAAATVLRKQVVCIEEPEIHLHPLLQKKLMRYLREKTDNQYFITTHSAHLLDTPGAAIFHIRHQDGVSAIDPVYTSVEKSLVCVDIGYRPSDILQANCVIWVEGPSDRIYLNHWVRSVADDLAEGIHYSIMFYGGRLLSHLTANDPEVTEFISLRRLNRYISILIDSDRDSSRANLNNTKKRVRKEFDEGPGFAWVTKGREIENYIASGVLEAAVKKVHRNARKLAKTGQFDHALHFRTASGIQTRDIDKVKIAHAVAESPADLEILDLKQQVTRLVKFIRSANDFDEESL